MTEAMCKCVSKNVWSNINQTPGDYHIISDIFVRVHLIPEENLI